MSIAAPEPGPSSVDGQRRMPEESEIEVSRPAPLTAPDQITPVPPAPVAQAGSSAVEARDHHVWPAAVAVTLVASVIAWVRTPTAIAGWLYAEDGRSFIGDWLGTNEPIRGDLSLLWMPYAGYQHLIPRLASGLVTALVPAAGWALAVNAIACLVVGSVAGLVFVFSRDVISFLPSRLVLAMLTVMTPMAGLEALGNLANLHWFLLYLTPWLLLATPRGAVGTWAMAAVAFMSVATEPQCAIFLPLAIWRIVTVRRTRPVVLCWLLGVVAQVITAIDAPRAIGSDVPPIASTIEGYVLNVGMTLGTTHPPLLGAVLVRLGWWVGCVGVAAILAVAAVGILKGSLPAKVAIAALIYGSVVSWTASFVLGRNPSFFYSEMNVIELGTPLLARWGTAASMLLAATIPVTVAVMVQRYPRWRPAWLALLAVLVLAVTANLIAHPGLAGQTWQNEVDAARVTCAATPGGEVELPTPPDPSAGDPAWRVDVPCSRLTG